MNSAVLRRVLAPTVAVAAMSAMSVAPAAAAPSSTSDASTQAVTASLNTTMQRTTTAKSQVTPATSKRTARVLIAQKRWSGAQFTCLDRLWHKESRWNHKAMNKRSGAYGIPQALPGRKMASAGKDWRTNPATQIKWGLGYIQKRYGTPCKAWSHSQSRGWY